jgi:hypothetical protein
MPTFTFTKTVTNAIRKGDAAKAAMALTIDAMVADGITEAHFAAKGIGDDSGFRPALKDAIINAFPKRAKNLLATPTKNLSVKAKADKKYWQQQVGSKVGDFKAAFKRRVNPKTGDGANARTDDKTFLVERLAACIKRVQKSENATFDCEAVKASLEAALKLVK